MSFYKLNKDYIDAFQKRIIDRYNKEDKRSETLLLKSVLVEINNLFRKIGGQTSSKRNIPKAGDYPQSKLYNQLLEDIGSDIDKIYNAQTIVESDIKDLINFNSSQRDRVFENMVSAQQLIYSTYIRSKKDLIGGIEVPSEKAFSSADALGDGSEDVFIDEDRGTLTLAFDSTPHRVADTKYTVIYFAGSKPEGIIYPMSDTLGIGSHWKQEPEDKDVHFLNQSNSSDVDSYKTMMIDDPNSNTGVGFCEFEMVETIDSVKTNNNVLKSRIVTQINDFLSNLYSADRVRIDKVNSFQGKYIKDQLITGSLIGSPKYRLVVPFTSPFLTNEVTVEFNSVNGHYPNVLWNESVMFSDIGGSDISYRFNNPETQAKDGRFICKLDRFIYPTRAEIMLEYSGEPMIWYPMPFVMSRYAYIDTTTYTLPSNTSTSVQITVKKDFDVFVDTEADEVIERTRARNVLENPNRN
jgi:hypothetical protein